MNGKFFYVVSVAALVLMLAFLSAWIIWLSSLQPSSIALFLILGVLPLLAPLRGILQGNLYTYKWCSFLALLYFVYGVALASNPDGNNLYGLLLTALSCAFFIGVVGFVRKQKRDAPASDRGDRI